MSRGSSRAPDADVVARVLHLGTRTPIPHAADAIGQRAVRKLARETFEHLLNMDMRFHLARQTGGLTRAIDRGTK